MYDIVNTLSNSVEAIVGGGLVVLALTIVVCIGAEIGRRRKARAEDEEYEDRDGIYAAIDAERDYQDERWGHEFDDKNTSNDWCSYVCRYATSAAGFDVPTVQFRAQMVKVAALAVAAIEATDRTGRLPPRHYD